MIVVYSPSDQQLGVLLSIVDTTGSMGTSLNWPRSSLRFLQFGPLLGQVYHSTHLNTFCFTVAGEGYVPSAVHKTEHDVDNSVPPAECTFIVEYWHE